MKNDISKEELKKFKEWTEWKSEQLKVEISVFFNRDILIDELEHTIDYFKNDGSSESQETQDFIMSLEIWEKYVKGFNNEKN